jgi:hypothetical protein
MTRCKYRLHHILESNQTLSRTKLEASCRQNLEKHKFPSQAADSFADYPESNLRAKHYD